MEDALVELREVLRKLAGLPMQAIILVAVIVLIYFLMRLNPFLAGLAAMIPVKIISALIFAKNLDVLSSALNGLLIGSFITTFCLFLLWIKFA